MKERRGWGKYRELRRHDYDTTAQAEEGLAEAAAVEVEKNHTLRAGPEWVKMHIGKKKRKEAEQKHEWNEHLFCNFGPVYIIV